MTWTRVTQKRPCAICQKPDWCTWSEIGHCCMRVPNEHPMGNGGFLYREAKALPAPPPRKDKRKLGVESKTLYREARNATTEQQIASLADNLGISPASLDDLGLAWFEGGRQWWFPMADANADIIGIRTRDCDGCKRSVVGSRSGLFYPLDGNWKNDFRDSEVWLCEGPTDTAAALTLGAIAVGRPSCVGQEAMICDLIRHARRVLIVADNDEPGLRGAEKLQGLLSVPSLVWVPPAKDLREFVRAGGTKAVVDCLVKNHVWHVPR